MISDTETPPVYSGAKFVVIDGMRFTSCPICGRIEQRRADGIIKIEHDFDAHFGENWKAKRGAA